MSRPYRLRSRHHPCKLWIVGASYGNCLKVYLAIAEYHKLFDPYAGAEYMGKPGGNFVYKVWSSAQALVSSENYVLISSLSVNLRRKRLACNNGSYGRVVRHSIFALRRRAFWASDKIGRFRYSAHRNNVVRLLKG